MTWNLCTLGAEVEGNGLCIPRSVPKYLTGHRLLPKPLEAALRRVVVSSNSTQ